MSTTDLENIAASFGLVRREFRDVHSVVSRMDHQMRRLFEPTVRPRPGGLVARLAACELIARQERRDAAAAAKQFFADDRDLARWIETRAAIAPAQTTVAGWASELAAIVTQDIADNLLPQTALAQLRAQGLAYAFIDGAVVKTPTHSAAPSRSPRCC